MDISEMKRTFYKRFDASDSFLHYTFTGALCNLLGHSEISGAPFLSCSLSMGVAMLSRRLPGGITKIQVLDSDERFSYTSGMPVSLFRGKSKELALLVNRVQNYSPCGAEILSKTSSPSQISVNAEFCVTLARALEKTCGAELSPMETACVAAGNSRLASYAAAAYSRSGYCVYVSENEPKNYPLPLTGYKIITAHLLEDLPARDFTVYDALDELRKYLPEVQTAAQLTIADAYRARQLLKSKRHKEVICHLAGENARIHAALRGLRRCDITSLFRAMNASQQSMEKYWRLRKEYVFAARLACDIDGIRAVRCTRGGAVFIAESDKADYAVNMMRNGFEHSVGYKPILCISDSV